MDLKIQASNFGCVEYSCDLLRDFNALDVNRLNSFINIAIKDKENIKMSYDKANIRGMSKILNIDSYGIIKNRYKLKKIPPVLLKYIERYDTMRDLRFNQSEIFKDKSLSIPFVGSDKNPCDKNFVMFFDNMKDAIKSGNFTSRFSEKNSMSKVVKPQHFENFYEKNGEVDKNKERDIQTRNFQERYENTKSYYLEPEEQDNFYRKF